MRKYFKSILCILMCVIALNLSSCSNKNKDNNEEELLAKIEYYYALGYHKISFDNNVKIAVDEEKHVVLSESIIMAQNNTDISISFNNENNPNFSLSNDNFANFETGLILSGFNVNEIFYEISDATFKIKTDVTISAKFNRFKTIGVAVYNISDDFPTVDIPKGKFDTLSTSIENPLFFYATELTQSAFSKNNLEANTELESTVTTNNDGTFSVYVHMSIYLETTDVKICLILYDEENNSYFSSFNHTGEFRDTDIEIDGLNNAYSSLKLITLKLGTSDIQDEY